ncbi:MAG: peptidoglycan DD-metalloendopeptidase family protein [Endomicrobia bacterium]|nr:peptidoglycan DD-metalloendopeptidase family protein [Endomicrobiia bacterium]
MKILSFLFFCSLLLSNDNKIVDTKQKIERTKQTIQKKRKEKLFYISLQRDTEQELKKIEAMIKFLEEEKDKIKRKIKETKIKVSALENSIGVLSSDVTFYRQFLSASLERYVTKYVIGSNLLEENFERRITKDVLKEFVLEIKRLNEAINYTAILKNEHEKEKNNLISLNLQLENKKNMQADLYKQKAKLLDEYKFKQKKVDEEIANLNKTQKELESLLRKLQKEEKEKFAKTKQIQSLKKYEIVLDKKFSKPIEGIIVGKFGKSQEQKNGNYILKNGVTLQGMSYSDVVAVESGKVIFVSNNFRSYGKLIIIEHKNDIHTIYANLGSILITEGNIVNKGGVIGKLDNTGQMYFEIRKNLVPLNPESYFE